MTFDPVINTFSQLRLVFTLHRNNIHSIIQQTNVLLKHGSIYRIDSRIQVVVTI